MKKISVLILVVMVLTILVGCAETKVTSDSSKSSSDVVTATTEVNYEDGTYRGTFSDSGSMQVGVQLKLEGNIVTEATFRHLEYKNVDYRKEETDKTIIALRGQYESLLEHLVGKDIREHLKDLYEPGNIAEDIDAFSGATVRAGKVISATRDALNRGVYSY